MALQSEVPPLGEANNTFDGQKKSDEDETEAEDLEEGEIQDSGADTEEDTAETKVTNPADAVKNGPKQSPNKSAKATESEESPLITDGAMEATANAKDNKSGSNFRSPSERYFNRFKSAEYVDHDRISESEDNMDINWCSRVRSKKSRSKNRVLDYRKELGDGMDSDDSKGEKKKKRKSKSRPKKLSESRRKKIIERNRKLRREGIIRRIAKPCKYFEEGSCHKGSDCPYQHIPKVPKKKELCRYFLSNNCRKMKTCPYMHGEFPCKFYHTGATCFSGDNCRFSHSPLTEEKKKLLHDYLRIHHADDYHHDKPSRKRESTPIPEPPQKRPCLLGSPPRHIKEAVETKRWQEEMIHLQREQQIDAFEIHLNDNQMALPSPHRRSNFYKDLLSSPVKERPGPRNDDLGPNMNQIPPNVNQMSPNINRMSPTVDNLNKMTARFGRIPENHSKDTVDWKNIQSLIEDLAEPDNNVESAAHDYHESSVAKSEPYTANNFYSTPSDTNGTSVIKNEPTYEDNDTFDDEYEDYKPLKINQDFGSGEESFSPKRSMDGSSPPHTSQPVAECPDPDPIIIPHHLPRKQRELMLRIQKHQKLKSTTDSDDVQIMEDKPESGAESEREVPEIIEAEDSDKKKTWDSSDDDDEDDVPLTIVLQKLNQTPPPKPKEVPPPQTEKLGPDLSQMLSSIMQKANENRLGSVYQEQNKFWTNILSGTVLPPAKTEPAPTATQLNLRNPVVEETNTTRRVLLPNPVPPPLPVVVEKPKPDIRDPRLKNRDPRMAAAAAATSVPNNAMKPEIPNVMPPLSILPLDVSSGRQVNPHHKDVNSLIPNQMPAAIVEGLKGNVPYRLREVEAEPLNYSSYVQASHSDPRLLNDPRLRKLLAPVHTIPNQTSTEKFINSVPKPSSVLPDLPLFASIMVETNPAPNNNNCTPLDMPSLPELHLPQLQPQQLQTVSDPRTRRIESRRISESNIIPPHPPIYEPHTLLPPAPTFTKSSAVPTPEPHILLPVAPTFSKSSTVPTPASHLPRAIVDPRMARLQDPRRMRTLSDPSNKSLVRHPPELKKPTPSITEQTAEPPQLPAMAESKEESKEAKTSPKTEEKSKKNKAVHRNRKTSMDYASPLNSCDDSRLSDTLNYNSYAKRPKKPPLNPPVIDLCGNDSPSVGSPLVPDFVTSDSSNLDGDCMDSNMISIKDVFKTRDPTASPFC